MAGLTSEDHRISRYAVFALFAIGIGCNGAELEVHDQQQAEPDGGVANADAEADPRDASHVSDPPRDSGATDAAPDAEVAPPDVGLPEMPNPCPNARVNIPLGVRLFIRPTPDTSGEAVGALYGSTVVKVVDTVEGEPIEGNTQWFQIESVAGDGFISAAFAECTFDPPQELAPPDGFYLPLPCDYTTTISQGNNGGFSHKGLYAYSWDFRVGIGTPLTAIADGTFGLMKRPADAGRGLDGVAEKAPEYFNPATEFLEGER